MVAKGGFWAIPKAIAVAALTTAQLAAGIAAVKSGGMAEGGMVGGNPNLGDAYPRMLTAGETVVPQKNFEDLRKGILANAQARGMGEGDQDLNVQLEVTLSDDAGKLFEVAEADREGLGY